jgi:hypothetical protein
MAGVHSSNKVVVVTQQFAKGGIAVAAAIISLITVATLLYVWLGT